MISDIIGSEDIMNRLRAHLLVFASFLYMVLAFQNCSPTYQDENSQFYLYEKTYGVEAKAWPESPWKTTGYQVYLLTGILDIW